MIAKFKEIMGIDCCKHKEEINALKLEHMGLLRDQQRLLDCTMRDLAEAKAIQHFTMSQSEKKIKELEEELKSYIPVLENLWTGEKSDKPQAWIKSVPVSKTTEDNQSPRRKRGRKKKRSATATRPVAGSQDQD